jgi:cytochrome c oxidase subunit II
MIDAIVPQVSTYARDIDNVILIVAALVGFWFLVASGAFFFLLWRYRYKPGVRAEYVDGSNPKHKRFITIPHNLVLLCDVVIVVAAVRVWVNVKQTLPEAPAGETVDLVRIVSQQWAWSFQYPGPDGKLDTADDVKSVDELHVKVNTVTHFELVSRDVLHDFSVPAFRLKQDAIPGRVIKGWFNAQNTGVYDIQCAEMCGPGHGIMFGKIVVETAEERDRWLAARAPIPAGEPPLPTPETLPDIVPSKEPGPDLPTPSSPLPGPGPTH